MDKNNKIKRFFTSSEGQGQILLSQIKYDTPDQRHTFYCFPITNLDVLLILRDPMLAYAAKGELSFKRLANN